MVRGEGRDDSVPVGVRLGREIGDGVSEGVGEPASHSLEEGVDRASVPLLRAVLRVHVGVRARGEYVETLGARSANTYNLVNVERLDVRNKRGRGV